MREGGQSHEAGQGNRYFVGGGESEKSSGPRNGVNQFDSELSAAGHGNSEDGDHLCDFNRELPAMPLSSTENCKAEAGFVTGRA